MAGALAERDFVEKLQRAGFDQVAVVHREPVGIDLLALYPLFTDDLVELMRQLIPRERHGDLARSLVVQAAR